MLQYIYLSYLVGVKLSVLSMRIFIDIYPVTGISYARIY
jgi:hypothetical protein